MSLKEENAKAGKRKVVKAISHRWLSIFFFIGAGLSCYQLYDSASLLKLIIISGSCFGVGLYFLLKKSQDFIWIQSNKLCFYEVRGKSVREREIPIDEIKRVRLEFCGSRQTGVIHRCYVENEDQKNIELPNGVIYSAYNPEHANMDFLMKPLREINSKIKLVIDDQVVGKNKVDFSDVH